MRFSKVLRLAILLPLTALTFVCMAKPEPESALSIHLLKGLEAPVYYSAEKPLTKGDKGELAVIMIHGWSGGVTIQKAQRALQEALGNTYVVAPMFPRSQIMERYGVAMDNRAIWNDSWPRNLTIPGTPDDDWRGGGDANGTQMSSYDVIDTILAKLSDKRRFPNLKKIVMVGFSAGGQFVGRYVAVGKGVVREGISLKYVAMAPSTFLLPNSNNTWHYGISNRPRYSRNLSNEQLMENLRSRRCLHACGVLDTLEKSLDKTPPAMQQGENRYIRFLNFKALVEKDARWREVTTFVTFDSIGHHSAAAYGEPAFVKYVTE